MTPTMVRAFVFAFERTDLITSLVVVTIGPFTANHEVRGPNVPMGSDRLSVDVTGHLYWWDVSYRQTNGLEPIAPAPSEANAPSTVVRQILSWHSRL